MVLPDEVANIYRDLLLQGNYLIIVKGSQDESAFECYQRIRGYWGVYVRDVTQGEDQSRIRTKPLPQILAIARNLSLNLYRDAGFDNMAQAYAERYPLGQRKCQFSLKHIASLFRMK